MEPLFWIMLFCCCAAAVFGLAYWRWVAEVDDMHREFTQLFPGRCSVCSYHRYGMTHGHIDPHEPVPDHDCIEN